MPPRKQQPPATQADPDDIELQADGPDLPVEPKSVQFPSLAGDPKAEVDKRTADGDGSDGRFRKTFVLDTEADPDNNPHAAAHQAAMRGEAVQRGLRATGDAELVNTEVERHRRGAVTTSLTYAMPVTPAAVADAVPTQD